MLIITYIRFHRHYPSIQHDRNFSYLAHPPSARHDQSYRSWLIMFSLKGYSFLYQNGAKNFIGYHFYFTLANMATYDCQVSHLWGMEGFVYGRYSEWASARDDQSCGSWLIMFSLKGYSFLYQNGAKKIIRYNIIFILHLQIWPPLVVKFLTSGVWKVLYMGGIQNEQVQGMTNPTDPD